jgi:hypothetical protein
MTLSNTHYVSISKNMFKLPGLRKIYIASQDIILFIIMNMFIRGYIFFKKAKTRIENIKIIPSQIYPCSLSPST